MPRPNWRHRYAEREREAADEIEVDLVTVAAVLGVCRPILHI